MAPSAAELRAWLLAHRRSVWMAAALLCALLLWQLWWCNTIVVTIDMPHVERAHVQLRIDATYGSGQKFENRPLFDAMVANPVGSRARIRVALPWRFERLRVQVFHPSFRELTAEFRANPHLTRVYLELAPERLELPPRANSMPVSEIARHYARIETEYSAHLPLRDFAEEIWPYLATLRMLPVAASFSRDGLESMPMPLKRERMTALYAQWNAMEMRARSAEFVPCAEGKGPSMGIPDLSPGCGLQPPQQ